MPSLVALALQADGWYVRSDIIWAKPNPMPESVTDRPTMAHEHVFLLASSASYYYDAEAVKQPVSPNSTFSSVPMVPTPYARPDAANDKATVKNLGCGSRGSANGRNLRSVWTIATKPYPEAHFAVFPTTLVEPCIKAGCPEGGLVLDPFAGSGTVGQVAARFGCDFIGLELSAEYCRLAAKRLAQNVMVWG